MRRRDFLRMTGVGSIVAATGAVSFHLIPNARAQDPDQPLWLHIHAGGGWDPSALCDPKPETNQVDFNVGTTSPTSAGHVFSYADLGASGAPFPNDPQADFAGFFETYKEPNTLPHYV